MRTSASAMALSGALAPGRRQPRRHCCRAAWQPARLWRRLLLHLLLLLLWHRVLPSRPPAACLLSVRLHASWAPAGCQAACCARWRCRLALEAGAPLVPVFAFGQVGGPWFVPKRRQRRLPCASSSHQWLSGSLQAQHPAWIPGCTREDMLVAAVRRCHLACTLLQTQLYDYCRLFFDWPRNLVSGLAGLAGRPGWLLLRRWAGAGGVLARGHPAAADGRSCRSGGADQVAQGAGSGDGCTARPACRLLGRGVVWIQLPGLATHYWRRSAVRRCRCRGRSGAALCGGSAMCRCW